MEGEKIKSKVDSKGTKDKIIEHRCGYISAYFGIKNKRYAILGNRR